MLIKYGAEIQDSSVHFNLKRITNQVYKLLPSREEGLDWEKPLKTLIEELAGMDEILSSKHDILFPLLCKLEGLFSLQRPEDFDLYRRTIFECLGLISELMKSCQKFLEI